MTTNTTVTNAVLLAVVVTYLISMMRFSTLIVRETDVKDVGFGGGANAQMRLLGVVFLKRDLDEAFAVRHAILLAYARWTGSVGFLLVMFVMVANLLGHRV